MRHMICNYLRFRQKHVQIVMHILFDHPPPKKKTWARICTTKNPQHQTHQPEVRAVTKNTFGVGFDEVFKHLAPWFCRRSPNWKRNIIWTTPPIFLGFHVHFPGWNEKYETWALDYQKNVLAKKHLRKVLKSAEDLGLSVRCGKMQIGLLG